MILGHGYQHSIAILSRFGASITGIDGNTQVWCVCAVPRLYQYRRSLPGFAILGTVLPIADYQMHFDVDDQFGYRKQEDATH
ncbi:hypothetical protein OAG60_00485 [bacterium]|nr:hypothetical protein [bacterium]